MLLNVPPLSISLLQVMNVSNLPERFVLLLFEALNNRSILSQFGLDVFVLSSESRLVECEIFNVWLVATRVMMCYSASTHFY
jgi:hypothetical protein